MDLWNAMLGKRTVSMITIVSNNMRMPWTNGGPTNNSLAQIHYPDYFLFRLDRCKWQKKREEKKKGSEAEEVWEWVQWWKMIVYSKCMFLFHIDGKFHHGRLKSAMDSLTSHIN